MSEQELIERALEGDEAAARELYDAHVDRIYRFCYRMAGEDHLAREFTQEAFIRAFTRLETFRGDAAFSTWLCAIAKSVTLNGLRKVKRFRGREVELDPEIRGDPDRRVEPDLKQKLERAIDGLAEGFRTVFVMHDLEGYTHEEIAEVLGIATGTSKSQLSRARARLREELEEFAGEWAC